MHENDDGFDSLLLELGHQRVDRLDLVVEREPGNPSRRDDRRRAFERHADERHRDALVLLDGVGRKDRVAGRIVDHIRGEELEVGAGEAITVEVTVDRVAAAVGHPEQFGAALVEFVIADAVDLEADEVHGLDRRLIVEQRRDQWRRTDQVAGGHGDRVVGVGFGCRHVRWPGSRRGRHPRTRPTSWRCCRGSR